MAQAYGLTWGTLDFISDTPTEEGFLVRAVADGTSFGNPDAQFEVVRSLLTAGSLAVLQGWDNREIPIRLQLSAPEGVAGRALAAAERVLMEHILAESKAPLVYVPSADGSPTTVFDVVAAKLERDYSTEFDLEETLREYRYYLLTLTCLPFIRPEDPVTVSALPLPPPVETHFTVDDGTSLTGWTAAADGFGTVTRTNLVTNPSFEGTQGGWTAGANTDYSWTNDPAGQFSGTGAANIIAASGSSPYIYSTTHIPVTAGAQYTVSAYVKDFDDASGFTANIQWWTSTAVISEVGSASVNPSDSSWQRVSHTATAPAGAVKARVVLRVTGFMALVDGVMFEQASSAGAYFDGDTATAGSTDYAWTGTRHASTSVAVSAPSPSTSSGAVVLSSTARSSASERTMKLIRSGSVSMASTPYLRVSAQVELSSGSAVPRFRLGTGTASLVTPIATAPSSIAGATDYYLATSDFDVFEAEAYLPSGSTTPTATLRIAHMERTDTIAGAGSTRRQQARIAEVVGSAPTQAAIRLYDPTPAALGGDILVHSSRNSAWQPPLRTRMVSSAAVTTDSAMVSGSRNTLTSAMVFRIPASLITEGTYALMGRLNVTVAGTLAWQARMVSSSGATTVGSSRVVTGSTALAVTTDYTISMLGSLVLPVLAAEADQMIELTLTGTANMTIDEAWLFGLDDGALTWLRDTDSLTWVELRSPELGAARPSVYGGTGALGNGAVCVDWKCEAFGAHRFDPGTMQVFTVTTSSLASQSELKFYPRYHSHAEN